MRCFSHRFSLRFNENLHLKHKIPLGRGIVGEAAQNKEAMLVPDVNKDSRYVEANPETRSELAVPLIYKNKVIGVLDLEHTRRGFFTDDHKRTMTTLAAQIAIALENARLYEEIDRQERRLDRDLSLARELQGRLLPQTNPKLAHLDVAAKFVPARAIGGDLYDFFPIPCRASASSSATSAEKVRPPRFMLRWSAGFCVHMPRSSRLRRRCFRRSIILWPSAGLRRSTFR